MENTEREEGRSILGWGTLGPLSALLTLLVITMKSIPIAFFLSGLFIAAFIACSIWGFNAFLGSIGALIIFLGGALYLDASNLWWLVAAEIAIALSLLIDTLAREEMEQLLEQKEVSSVEPPVCQPTPLLIYEKKCAEYEELKQRFGELAERLAKKEGELVGQHSLLQKGKQELEEAHGRHQQVLDEVFQKREEIASLTKNLEETNRKFKEFESQVVVSKEQDHAITRLKELLKQREQEVFDANFRYESLLKDYQDIGRELADRKQEYIILKETSELEKRRLSEVHQDQLMQQGLITEMSQTIESLTFQKRQLEDDLETAKEAEHIAASLKTSQEALRSEVLILQQDKERLETQYQGLQGELAQIKKASEEHRDLFSQKESQLVQTIESLTLQKKQLEEESNIAKEDLQSKALTLRQDKERLESQLQSLQGEVAQMKKASEEHSDLFSQKERQLVQTIESLTLQKKQLEEESNIAKEDLQGKALILQQDKERLESQHQSLQCELVQYKRRFEENSEEVKKGHLLISSLKIAHESLQSEAASLRQNKDTIEQQFHKLQDEMAVMKASQIDVEESSKNERAVAIAEGKYLQLREQFIQKSRVLDETRKELFHTRETLEALKRDFEESTHYSLGEFDGALQNYINELHTRWEEERQQWQREAEHYEEIIGVVLRGSSSQ